jgi:hypothetical protein
MQVHAQDLGADVQVTHGLAESLASFEAYEQDTAAFSAGAAEFIDDLVSHYVLDDGRLSSRTRA